VRLAVLTAVLAALAAPGVASAANGFRVGAATVSFTPPRPGKLADDPADCATGAQMATFDGHRDFAFEEPYQDLHDSGEYSEDDPFLDCNGNGRWDGNFLGGGSGTPRFYDHVADRVGARAMVVSNGRRKVAVEVLDNEGAFNTYIERIRAQVAADGYHLDGIYISSTHDESAPDTIGIAGVSDAVSSVNDYFADYMVRRAAKAIERAADRARPATIRYAEAREPARLRQCWSSYPYVDDQLMPSLRAVDSRGRTIVTLGDVSQHAETLGFNDNAAEARWISADWVHFFRSRLERRFGGVAIEMAGSVGSVESPEVFAKPVSRVPQRYVDEDHPAGCRTLFDAPAGEQHAPLGYRGETRAFGNALARSAARALANRSHPSRSRRIWGQRADICVPLTNDLFLAAATAGVFAQRPGYSAGCSVEHPVLPNGTTSGDEVKSQVAAFRIGDGTFVSVPGEVFPFTFLRGPLGPQDLPSSQYGLPRWPLPHMHTPYRFVDGLGEDMIGYIFPRGNGVGVPGENGDPTGGSGDDRFGCHHSDDGEAASSQSGDIIGAALVGILKNHERRAERVVPGRYLLPGAKLSRDPLGGPFVKCDVDTKFHFAGHAREVWIPGRGRVKPAAWMSLSGRRQAGPDRNTRGYFSRSGKRHWLDVFAPLGGSD
jgi:hypothetical protein